MSDRKHIVAAVFVDLANRTLGDNSCTADQARAIISGVLSDLEARSRASGGVIVPSTETGFLVCFGYPHATESPIESAIKTALDVAGALKQRAAPQQPGVGFGVAALEIEGFDHPEHTLPTALEQVAATAARLQSLAGASEIIASGVVKQLAHDLFEWSDVGPHVSIGATAEGHAYAVQAHTRGPAAHPPRMRSPLIGRIDELKHLERCWQQAHGGHGNTVIISGEAGIGKSRLTAELESRVNDGDIVVVRFQCSPFHSNTNLYPLNEHLSQLAGVRRDDPEAVRHQKIEQLLTVTCGGTPPARLVKSLVIMSAPETPGDAPQTLLRLRDELLQGLQDGFADLATVKPLLIILEDAQWLDATSNELLERMVKSAPGRRVLTVVTARHEFDPIWIGAEHTSIVIPRRLNTADAMALAASVAGKSCLSFDEQTQLVERSEGVPLFVEELSRAHAAANQEQFDAPSASASLKTLLMARIERVGPAKKVAQVAAALGRKFNHDICADVWGGSAAEFDQSIADLMAAELLLPKPIRPGADYSFRHALLQEAAYDSLPLGERSAVHARIVRTLARSVAPYTTNRAAILAHHCERADHHLEAARHWLDAGNSAAWRAAADEAANCYRLGLKAADRCSDGDARDRIEFELNMRLGPALMLRQGYTSDEALAVFSRARSLMYMSRSSLEDIQVLHGLFNSHLGRGEMLKALEVGKQVDELLTVGFGGFPLLMGQVYCLMGRFPDARRCLERALALYDSGLDDKSSMFCRADVIATSFLSKAEFALGNIERSVALTGEAARLAQQDRHPVGIAITSLGNLLIAMDAGNIEEAQQIADAAYTHVTEQKLGNYQLWVGFFRAVLSMRTDPAASIAEMHRIINAADAMGTLTMRPAQLALLGAAYASAGKHETAIEMIGRGLEIANHNLECDAVPALHRLRAKILMGTNPAAAIQDLETSIAVARKQSALMEQLRSTTMLARVLKDTPRSKELGAQLAAVYQKFTAGHHHPDLKQAQKVLASFEGSRR